MVSVNSSPPCSRRSKGLIPLILATLHSGCRVAPGADRGRSWLRLRFHQTRRSTFQKHPRSSWLTESRQAAQGNSSRTGSRTQERHGESRIQHTSENVCLKPCGGQNSTALTKDSASLLNFSLNMLTLRYMFYIFLSVSYLNFLQKKKKCTCCIFFGIREMVGVMHKELLSAALFHLVCHSRAFR